MVISSDALDDLLFRMSLYVTSSRSHVCERMAYRGVEALIFKTLQTRACGRLAIAFCIGDRRIDKMGNGRNEGNGRMGRATLIGSSIPR